MLRTWADSYSEPRHWTVKPTGQKQHTALSDDSVQLTSCPVEATSTPSPCSLAFNDHLSLPWRDIKIQMTVYCQNSLLFRVRNRQSVADPLNWESRETKSARFHKTEHQKEEISRERVSPGDTQRVSLNILWISDQSMHVTQGWETASWENQRKKCLTFTYRRYRHKDIKRPKPNF